MLGKKNSWGFLDSGFNESSYNMAVDEVLLNRAVQQAQKYPVLRVYGFYRNALTLGYSQKIKELVGLEGYKKQGYELCRRITGGGAVFHGQDLTYSLIIPTKEYTEFASVIKSYRLIHETLVTGLKSLGLKLDLNKKGKHNNGSLCFESPVPDDLMIGKEKLGGAAQKRAADYLLHQGSIDLTLLHKSDEDFFDLFDKTKKAILDGFKKTFNTEFVLIDMSLKELEEARELSKEKYQAFSWNFRC